MFSKDEPLYTFILKAVIAFVVIAGGVYVGLFISVESGLTAKLSGQSNYADLIKLKEGDEFPSYVTSTSNSRTVDVQEELQGHNTIMAFVSPTCGPCKNFVAFLNDFEGVKQGEYQVFLLSKDPSGFSDLCKFEIGEASKEFLKEYEIHAFPTIIGTDRTGKIRFVKSGFSSDMDGEFFREQFNPKT